MTSTIATRFHDARGLVLFATTLAFAAGVIGFLRHGGAVYGLPVPLFTGLVYAAFVGTAALATSIALPALGAMIGAVAISRLGTAVLSFGWPDFGTALQHSPMLSATVVVGGALVVRRLAPERAFARWSVARG